MSIIFNPICNYPDESIWVQELTAAKVSYKAPEEPHALVLYTDGGCKPSSRGQAGWGIHGFSYINVLPKMGHGTKGFIPTPNGHENTKGNEAVVKSRAVSVLLYIDAFGVIAGLQTSSVGELHAFYHALQLAKLIKPVSLLIKTDSEYVVKGTNQYLDIWKESKWIRSNGEPVANLDIWKAIDALLTELRETFTVTVKWTKGHKDSVGNVRADQSASEACLAGLNGFQIDQVKINSPKKYWNPENEYNRLLSEKYWYFVTDNKSHKVGEHYVYYMGNHGDEISVFGKPISDANFAVIFTPAFDPVLEKIRIVQDRLTRHASGAIAVADVSLLTKPAVYKRILDADDNVPFLYRDKYETVMEDPFKLSLTTELKQPGLAYEGLDILNDLQDTLEQYLKGNVPHMRVINITDSIYESIETKGVESLRIKIPPNADAAVLTIKDVLFVDSQCQEQKRDLRLVIGLDLPKRQTLAAIVTREPKVSLITWPEVSECHAFRYACVIETLDGDVGIWAAPYANLSIGAN